MGGREGERERSEGKREEVLVGRGGDGRERGGRGGDRRERGRR